MSFGDSWKALGNQAYQGGDFLAAVKHFTQAIEADANNATFYCNRSLAYAALKEWSSSLQDAKQAIQLDVKYVKAHFRLCKALLMLHKVKEVRRALLFAIKECGEAKELKPIEDEIYDLTGIAVRPKSTDFEIMSELGSGNYSKIYKTYAKKNKKVFAVKTIERQTVDRMKRRHPNINNEILMEKRVLQSLDHPGVVTLFATFQDYGTLYYQMEYIGGYDLWTALHEIQYDRAYTIRDSPPGQDAEVDPVLEASEDYVSTTRKGKTGSQVGISWSLLRFYMAELLSALEHMHRKGFVHRDIKPENIIVTTSGHVKFIDFGTAKDLTHRDLNGQDFVGTPEYMSPETVYVKNTKQAAHASSVVEEVGERGEAEPAAVVSKALEIGLEADHWAMGVMLHQLVFGYTPFQAPSPYLVFLRIKRDLLMMPDWTPAPIASLIRLFLTKDPRERLQNCLGVDLDCSSSDPAVYAKVSYDSLRQHAFFTNWHDAINKPQQAHYSKLLTKQEQPAVVPSDASGLDSLSALTQVYDEAAHRVPSLHDLCLRAVANAAVTVAFATSDNGGIRPKVPWMQAFQLQRLSPLDNQRVAHFLERKQQLHIPAVFRLFHNSLPESRCKRANVQRKEVVGFTRSLQGHYTVDFHFVQLHNPAVGHSLVDHQQLEDSVEETRLKASIANINKIRPKFVMCFGNLTEAAQPSVDVEELWTRFRKCIARVSDTIPVLFVPGPAEMQHNVNQAHLELYRTYFGADYYSFWYQGMKGIVINSSMMLAAYDAQRSNVALDCQAEADIQDDWFDEEIEQAKLCATTITVFAYHPFFYEDMEEEDVCRDGGKVRSFPKELRTKWLHKLRHHKVKFVFSGAAEDVDDRSFVTDRRQQGIKVFAKKANADQNMTSFDNLPTDINPDQEKAVLDGDEEPQHPDTDDDEFENVDDTYEGPALLTNLTATTPASSTAQPAYRMVFVREEAMEQTHCAGETCPQTMQQALDLFQK